MIYFSRDVSWLEYSLSQAYHNYYFNCNGGFNIKKIYKKYFFSFQSQILRLELLMGKPVHIEVGRSHKKLYIVAVLLLYFN